jgi:hypothetical protein
VNSRPRNDSGTCAQGRPFFTMSRAVSSSN